MKKINSLNHQFRAYKYKNKLMFVEFETTTCYNKLLKLYPLTRRLIFILLVIEMLKFWNKNGLVFTPTLVIKCVNLRKQNMSMDNKNSQNPIYICKWMQTNKPLFMHSSKSSTTQNDYKPMDYYYVFLFFASRCKNSNSDTLALTHSLMFCSLQADLKVGTVSFLILET